VGKAARKDEAYQQVMKELEQEAALPEGKQRMDQKARRETWENGLLNRKGRLWVPQEIVQGTIKSEHDTKVAGHMGQDKTIELIRWNFRWSKMNDRIIDFVQSCPEC